jgi:beta-phosphoglucomutase
MQTVKNDFAVIFDMDGVIVDSNPYHKIVLRQFCQKHGIFLSEEQLKTSVFGRTNKDWLTAVFGKDLTPEKFREYEDEKESIFRRIYAPEIKPVDGLIRFLDQLESASITRAIATSAPPGNVDFTLEYTGTKKYFDTIVDGDGVKHSKPHPEIYLKTANQIGFEPEKCVVFEDSLSGVESAHTAGCKVIGITTTHQREEFNGTELVIDNFNDIGLPDLERLFHPVD